jgi:hypothetical protein
MAQSDNDRLPSAESRLVFGRTLQAWCRRAGWGHDLCMKWGKAAGFPSVADSTFSRLQNGKIEQPFPITFIHFGILNSRIANRDYGLPEAHPIVARLERQEPITAVDHSPWRASEFFSHFIGELEPPTWALQPSLLSLEEAVQLSASAAERFRARASERGLPPAQAWQSFQLCASGLLSGEELAVMRDVLAGWATWTPEQLRELDDGEGTLRCSTALDAWLKQPD